MGGICATCKQTKKFLPEINLKMSAITCTLDRETLSKTIQLLTGHGYNRHHLRILGLCEDEICRYCLEEDELTWHIVAECEDSTMSG